MFIGGGVMARAVILGCIDRAAYQPADFAVTDPDPVSRAAFEAAGVRAFPTIAAAAGALGPAPARTIVLAVKPQSLPDVAAQWTAAGIDFDAVLITMLAGTPSSRIRSLLGGRCRVVRVMPNTPARIAQGATAIALGDGARPGDEHAALTLFSAVGPIIERTDESLMDAVTALSGSGPAYLFALAEAMVRGGIEAGLPPDAADRLARQTLLGAAALLAQSGDTPAALRAAVTSKGGTTEAALKLMDARAVGRAITDAVLAARDRGRELGAG